MLKKPANCAVVCARGLGDALLSMILARNLTLSQNQVTIFSSILCELRDWFPGYTILPYPPKESFHSTFSSFEVLIAADYALVNENHHFGNQLLILKESAFNKSRTMVDNLQDVCQNKLSLPVYERSNGITAPSGLSWRSHPNRVALHPMSSTEKKNWPAKKFISLSKELEKRGFSPYFCVCPVESQEWKNSLCKTQLPHFPTVSAIASFLYESGYLIGNDSGLGHLASSLGIPTLSLFARHSNAKLWRPGWAPSVVATPLPLLIGAGLKQAFWKHLLPTRRVAAAFDKLIKAQAV